MDGYGRFPAGGTRSPSRIPDFPSSRPQYGGSGVSTLERRQRSHSMDTRGELYPSGRYGSGGGGGGGSSARYYYSSGMGNGAVGGGSTVHSAREQRATYKSQYHQQQQPRQYHTDSGRLGRDAFFNDSITLGAKGVRSTAALGGGGMGGTMIPIRRGVAPYHHRSAHAGLDRAGLGEEEGEWTSYDKSVRYNRERTEYPPPVVRERREEHAKRDFTRESGASAYGYGSSRGPPTTFQPQAITYPVGVVESDYASRREHEMHQGRNATTGEAAFADYRDSGSAAAGQHQSYHHSHHRSRHHHESSGGGRGGWSGSGAQHYQEGARYAYDGARPLLANGGPNYMASGAQQQHQQYNASSRHSSGRQHRTASAGATSGGWYTGGGRNIIGGRTRSKEKQPQQLYQQHRQYYYQGDKPPLRYHKVRCCCFTMKWPPWAVEPCDPPQPMYASQWDGQRGYYNRKGYSVPPPQYPPAGGEISHQINIQTATPPPPPSDSQPPPSANIQYQPGLQQYPPAPPQQHLPYHQPLQPYPAEQYLPQQYPPQQHRGPTGHTLQPLIGGAPRHY